MKLLITNTVGKLRFRTAILHWSAWATLAFIAFATLSPIEMRPAVADSHDGHIEHFAAFATTGFLFILAYPRRLGPIILLVIAAAISLELLQLVVPGRHARVVDAAVKCSGAFAGMGLAIAILQCLKVRPG